MSSIAAAAPQLLIEDLARSVAFYQQRLGFECTVVHEGYYAELVRDGVILRLRYAAQRRAASRPWEKGAAHLDAYLVVTGIRSLYADLLHRQAPIVKELEEHPWGILDFHVEDPDGYLLCFSESV